MSAEDQTAAPDAPGDTEPTQVGTEQTEIAASNAFEAALLRQAAEDGHTLGIAPPPKPEPEEPEVPEPVEAISDETETEDEPDEEEGEVVLAKEEKPPEDKGDKLVPLREVLEERGKKKRAAERADKAEALVAQLQSQLSSVMGPQPTEDNPLVDVHNPAELDSLEKSYEKVIELADENPDALVEQTVDIEKKRSGVDLRERYSDDQIAVIAKRKAEKAIRKFIPERKEFLKERQIADAQAEAIYPEFKDADSEFTQTAAYLAKRILSGEAVKDPTLMQWIGHAVKGYQMSLQKNGKEKPLSTDNAKKIVESSRQKIAPTPTRTRSIPERVSRGAELAKAEEELRTTKTHESGEKYLDALFARSRSGAGKVERVA